MPKNILFLTEEDVNSVLQWDAVFNEIKQAMSDLSNRNTPGASVVIQPVRSFMHMPHKKGVMLIMPGLSERKNVLSCKLVTSFLDNPIKHTLPSILANIMLFNPDTGVLQAVLEGTTITEWRTAAASAVATYYLKPGAGKEQTLSVFGAGRQARIHIIAFQNYFKFKNIKLWNRTYENGLKLADELKREYNIEVEVCVNKEECAKNGDVIVTATYTSEPLIKYEHLKPNVMINAVGAGIKHHCELHKSIYEKSSIYTDSMENANIELKGLIEEGYEILGEVGEIINGQKKVVLNDVIIFHSLGMGLEDGVTAQLAFKKYIEENDIKP